MLTDRAYEVDHYLDDHGDVDRAVKCVLETLPAILPGCRDVLRKSVPLAWPTSDSN